MLKQNVPKQAGRGDVMGRRKKSGSGGVLGGLALLALAALTFIPKEVWIGIGVLLVLALIGYVHGKFKGTSSTTASPSSPPPPAPPPSQRRIETSTERDRNASRPRRHVDDDVPVSVAPASKQGQGTSGFSLPPAPAGVGPATWIPAGQAVTVGGVTIPGGMVYVGSKLPTHQGGDDPSLLNPSKSVAHAGDYTERKFGYWPNYAEIDPTARRAYLNWLAGGRADPNADIGYVFLFFYGLERRAILDAAADGAVKSEWPVIATELRRLLSIYGKKSQSFNGYASGLLEWVSISDYPDRLYDQSIPAFAKGYELPFYVRLALGLAAKDGAPVPGHLALAWVRLGPYIQLRTAATRCPEQFDQLFLQHYKAVCGIGMVLPRNKTKLKVSYRPASAGFRGYNELSMTVEGAPDVTVLKAPLKQLTDVVEKASAQLDPFSRAVGKSPGTGDSLDTFVYLPLAAWPESAQKTVGAMSAKLANGTTTLQFQVLLNYFGFKGALTKEKAALFAGALEASGIGFEPDILAGAKLPKPEDHVVLFGSAASEPATRTGGSYIVAALTLQLASAVAAADGDFSIDEATHLRRTVQSWSHLAPTQVRRLLAHIELLRVAPASLAALTKKLEPLDSSVKETLAAFMASVAQADGVVSPAEVKMLERIYKALGIESKRVFTDVHAVATGAKPASTPSAQPAGTGFKLDHERIAQLQRDTERASSMLANIFAEAPDEGPVLPTPEPVVNAEPVDVPAGLMGLDETHTALVRMLMSRQEWSRADLQDIASDLDLMLDGALEHINEAAFDTHDMPFFEGEDPVTINAEFLEKVHA
jgi:uncharacterized tellurite resistance protein B-like protein